MTLVFLLITFASPWTFVLFHSLLPLLLVSFVSVVSVLFPKKKMVLTLLVLVLCIVQIDQIQKTSLVPDTPVHQIEVKNNLAAYPALPLPIAYWFEQKGVTQNIYALTVRAGEVLSPSLYFFSNHPRERSGYREFEKFQYILLPFFVLGLCALIKNKNYFLLMVLFIPGIVVFTLFGNRGELGPFLFFPFFAASIVQGLGLFFKKVDLKLLLFFVLFILVTIQTYAYTIF